MLRAGCSSRLVSREDVPPRGYVLADNVPHSVVQGSLDTYRFCDEVWTFLIKNVTFKMDNGSQSVQADKVKIVSCNAKKPGEGP